MRNQLRTAFMLGKRSATESRSTDQPPATHQHDPGGSSSTNLPTTQNYSGGQQRVAACVAQTSTAPPANLQPAMPDLAAIDDFLNSVRFGSYLTQAVICAIVGNRRRVGVCAGATLPQSYQRNRQSLPGGVVSRYPHAYGPITQAHTTGCHLRSGLTVHVSVLPGLLSIRTNCLPTCYHLYAPTECVC